MRSLVVHATDVLARAFQSVSVERRASDGRPTNALFGAVRTIRRALSFRSPDRAIAVLATEPPEGWPPALTAQIDPWRNLLEAHGLALATVAHPEHTVADYVRAALAANGDVVVVGSDKRLAQLVGERVWWYEGHKDVRYTPDAIYKRFGVAPGAMADWLALVGLEDVLDGVKGIGKKGAVELLEAHASLEQALADPEAVEGRVGRALRASLSEARDQL